jgi:hypothetical protein
VRVARQLKEPYEWTVRVGIACRNTANGGDSIEQKWLVRLLVIFLLQSVVVAVAVVWARMYLY